MNRLLIAVPLFVVGFIVSKTDFGLIWRYFGWANQTLATIVLWTAAVYLSDQKKFHWIASIPAVFMTVVVTTFLCYSDIGLSLSMPMATGAGIVAATLCGVLFLRRAARPGHVD